MSKQTPIHYLARGLHQDCMAEIESIEHLARNVLEFLTLEERSELAAYLHKALENKTPSELKGEIKRSGADIIFNSKAATEFLKAIMQSLESSE